MATIEDLRRIALALPGAQEGESGGFGVADLKGKFRGFAWVWLERLDPKKARIPNPEVWAVTVPSLAAKDVILDSNPEVYFTEPHYNGFPAVLVRLAEIEIAELETLIEQAWHHQANRKR